MIIVVKESETLYAALSISANSTMFSAMSATFGRASPLVAFSHLPFTSRSNSFIRICQSPKRATRSAPTIKAELDDDRMYAIYPPEEETDNFHRCAMTMAKPVSRAKLWRRKAKLSGYETSDESLRFAVGSGNWFLVITATNLGTFCLLIQALINAIQTVDKVDFIGRDKEYLEEIRGYLQRESIVPQKNFRLYRESPKDDVVREPGTCTEMEKDGDGKKKLVCYDEDCKFFCTTCRRSVILVRSQVEGSLSIPTV